jgi:indolepyruvate ferredoxin oxidoreductase beta subunit
MTTNEFNLVFAGVGGQGSVLASHIIAEAAIMDGQKVRVGETFGAAQRGGKVHSHVRIGQDVYGPLCKENSVDVLLGCEPNETLRMALKYCGLSSVVITNTREIPSMDVNIGVAKYPDIKAVVSGLEKLSGKVIAFDATKLSIESGSDRAMNVVLLGALAATGLTPFKIDNLREAIRGRVPPSTVESNMKAFDAGYTACKNLL